MSFAILEQILLAVEAILCQCKHVLGWKSTPKETVLLRIAPLLQKVMFFYRCGLIQGLLHLNFKVFQIFWLTNFLNNFVHDINEDGIRCTLKKKDELLLLACKWNSLQNYRGRERYCNIEGLLDVQCFDESREFSQDLLWAVIFRFFINLRFSKRLALVMHLLLAIQWELCAHTNHQLILIVLEF